MQPVVYTPIGTIRSPFQSVVGTPIQAAGAQGAAGTIELDSAYSAGLHDIEHFSHLTLIYHLHECAGYSLQVTPFLDNQTHGIFATRSPRRPNPIGLSTVRLVGVSGNTLLIEDVDVVDNTPLLDIKPYVPAFDDRPAERIGWYDRRLHNVAMRADDRFV
jgi:tRNA-Thr(GGU) m(6)t(6)A37 methyltransferase TsaA